MLDIYIQCTISCLQNTLTIIVCKQTSALHIINPRIYHILRRHVFLLIYFIKIYNLYCLFLYMIAQVKIHYKKNIHSQKFVKLKIFLILILIGKIWPNIWLYFTSHPKYYKKTYVEWKIIQTFLGN